MPNLTTSTDVDTFMGSADQAAMRTNMGLGTAATEASTAFAPATSGTAVLKGNGTGGFSNAAAGTDFAPATSGTAILKGSGTGGFSNAAAGTDYAPATSGSAILKGNGAGGFSSASSGTDYAPATSGSAILKGNGAGGFSSAAAGTDYAPATSGTALLKGNGAGGFSNAAAGTDYAPATSGTSILKGDGSGAFSSATANTDYQGVSEVKSSNFTAANNGFYVTTATCTVTDPTPAEGQGFSVVIRNGTTTIGGTAYATAGVLVRRIYHSGAWANYASLISGGPLGTPSSGTLTNCTGLPTSALTGQVALANGGTGANLTDPNADRIMFWDDSAGAVTWLTAGSGLSITDTTLTATGGSSAWSSITGRPQTKALTSNVSTTSTSFSDVTGLTIAVSATGTYVFEVVGWFTSSVSTEGIKFAMNGPTASFLSLSVAYGATTTYANGYANYTAYDDGPTLSQSGGSTPREFRIQGTATISATGTFAVRFAAETGGANSATVNSGSFFRLTPVD